MVKGVHDMTQVIINDVTPREQFTATAGQTVFNVLYTADATTDINVYARASAATPADDTTQIVNPIDYVVTFVGGQQTVRVTFMAGRTAGEVITIVRNTPATRKNLYTNTNFLPSFLNEDFSILTLIDQQNKMNDSVIAPHYNVSAIIEPDSIAGGGDTILPILPAGHTWIKNPSNTAIQTASIPPGGSAPAQAEYWVSTANPDLLFEVDMSTLGSGLLKQATVGPVATPAIAASGLDYWAPGNVITLPGLPTAANDATNKSYVDSVAAGFFFLEPVESASTTNFSATYNNGTSGVGATLTAIVNGAASLDGISLALNDRVLFKNQTSTLENGIYTVTQVGSGGTPAIYTRATDYDEPSDIDPGDMVSALQGTVNASTFWVETSTVTAIGTDPIIFALFGVVTSDVVTISGTQSITGAKTFDANVTIDNGAILQLNATIAIDEILDEDNMVSDSATAVPTQQSVKAYVDASTGDGGLISINTYTSSTTWNRPTGCTKVFVEVLGAGGGGGAATTDNSLGAGGAGGGFGQLLLDVTAISSVSVTIGAAGTAGSGGAGGNGGTSSFGAHVSCTGGEGGAVNGTSNINSPGGSTGGDINTRGQYGGRGGTDAYAIFSLGSIGASSQYGGGGRRGVAGSSGQSASGFGSGGGGGYRDNTTSRDGGSGAGGLVRVWNYY